MWQESKAMSFVMKCCYNVTAVIYHSPGVPHFYFIDHSIYFHCFYWSFFDHVIMFFHDRACLVSNIWYLIYFTLFIFYTLRDVIEAVFNNSFRMLNRAKNRMRKGGFFFCDQIRSEHKTNSHVTERQTDREIKYPLVQML